MADIVNIYNTHMYIKIPEKKMRKSNIRNSRNFENNGYFFFIPTRIYSSCVMGRYAAVCSRACRSIEMEESIPTPSLTKIRFYSYGFPLFLKCNTVIAIGFGSIILACSCFKCQTLILIIKGDKSGLIG